MAADVLDTETCGLHGPIVLVQWGKEDSDDINLHSPWERPISETLALFESFASNPDGIIGFNLAFDWFHIYKDWTIYKMLEEVEGLDAVPEEHIELIVELEERARDYPYCLKPVTALDLFLHARKGPYQSTMERKDVKIRKVPSSIAWMLADELEKRVPLRDIYFARRKGQHKFQKKWQLSDRKDSFGIVDDDWKDIVVRFKPSSALKALAVDALGVPEDEILKFGDISPKMNPVEFGYAPFAKAAMQLKLKNKTKERKREGYTYKRTWPDVIKQHIIHWGYNELAREYARKDIVYTRALRLHKDFINAKMGDDDSVLACMIGCNRWRGYKLNIEGIKKLKQKAIDAKFWINNQGRIPLPTAPRLVKNFIMEVCNETEKLGIMQADTGKITLEELAKDKLWMQPCPWCTAEDGVDCKICNNKRMVLHPAQERALLILRARKADKERELYDKLLAAGRLHASFKVIGALSSRMSGADGLNPQGIKKTKDVKENFLFAWDGEVLSGGDFGAFEVTIAVAVYHDDELQKDLLTCEKCRGPMIFNQKVTDYTCTKCGSEDGMKIHALFGIHVFPPMTYDEIKATDGTSDDIYTRCKSAVFTLIYMGGPHSMHKKLGVEYEVAEEGERKFKRKYKGVARAQEKTTYDYGALRQPGGRGTKVEWHEPKETVTTLFGFSRYFTLENRIIKSLFTMASSMPKNMRTVKVKVIRTDREQFAGGAAMSAIYSAAFALQGHNIRAAGNHVIQGSGSQITKKVQRRIWDIQPSGVHTWLVQPMNIHDSIMTPSKPEVVDQVAAVVKETVEEVRPIIPLIKMPWKMHLENWADKKGKKRVTNDQSTGKTVA